MIYFDLDGVIRGLSHDLRNGRNPLSWSELLPNGEDLCEHIDKNLHVLLSAPVTPYFDVIEEFPYIHIITNQRPTWKENTLAWIDKYLGHKRPVVHFVKDFNEKMGFLGEKDLIVDDYPFFKDNSKVILVDYPYNRNVKNPYRRVKTAAELEDVLYENSNNAITGTPSRCCWCRG